MADGEVTTVTPPPIRLDPFEPYLLDVTTTISGHMRTTRGVMCSGAFEYSGKPGHVVGRYYGSSLSKTYGMYVKLEPFVARAYNEVYWTVEDDFAPILTVANFSNERDTVEIYASEADPLSRCTARTWPGMAALLSICGKWSARFGKRTVFGERSEGCTYEWQAPPESFS
jgi:hypothetical protein